MSAKSRVLDAYESILLSEGERAATMDAIAARAEVSKGGLLYHFKDKNALADGLIERLVDYAVADCEAMRRAPEGPSRYYVRTSAFYLDLTNGPANPIDRTYVAVLSLGQEAQPKARRAMKQIHADWHRLILDEVGDAAIASAILLMGDGLYYNAAIAGGGLEDVAPTPDSDDAETSGAAAPDARSLESLLAVVDHLIASAKA